MYVTPPPRQIRLTQQSYAEKYGLKLKGDTGTYQAPCASHFSAPLLSNTICEVGGLRLETPAIDPPYKLGINQVEFESHRYCISEEAGWWWTVKEKVFEGMAPRSMIGSRTKWICVSYNYFCAQICVLPYNPPSSVWICGKHCDSASDGGKV